jgi:D-alanine-D-alanine ligase
MMKIEIITTPNELLKETGFGTLKACNDVLTSLQKKYTDVSLVICSHTSELDFVVKRKPDLVILAVKYIVEKDAQNIWLSSYFDKHKINYTGSSRETLKLDSDKVLAKKKIQSANIKTAAFFTTIPNEYKKGIPLPIDYLLFLKPIDAANGNGSDEHSLVNDFEGFTKKVKSLHKKYQQPILCEKYLSGREFTVAIMETATKNTLSTAAIEIIPPEDINKARILSAKVKKEDIEVLQKITNETVKDIVTQVAVDAFYALGVKGFGRIDIKMDENNNCYFMEANLVPGMTKGSSYFPKAFEIANKVNYDSVIQLIASVGLSQKTSPAFKRV